MPVNKDMEAFTYAIGDLHREVTLLKKLLDILPFRPEDTLVFLGDYMDRGEDSIATIRELKALKKRHTNTIFIRGNHDQVWLDHWNGYEFDRMPDMPGADVVWESCNGRVPFEVGDWLEETQIEYQDQHAYYVHAGYQPGKSAARTSDMYKLWGIPDFLQSRCDWGKPVVFGHWTLEKPLIEMRKIGVDTGAWTTGVLTAIRMPDREIFQAHK